MCSKRLAALFLAVIILVPVFAACGDSIEGTEKIDPGMGYEFSVTFGKNTITAKHINTAQFPAGDAAIYTRDYKDDNKYVLAVPNTDGRTLITVSLKRQGDADEFSVTNKTSSVAYAEIPYNGFVLSVPNSMLENVRCGVGSLAKVVGYDSAVGSYEEHSYATFSVNGVGSVSTRRISVVDPLSPTKNGKIYVITEDYTAAARFPEGSTVVDLKQITSRGFEVTDVAPAGEIEASEDGLKMVLCGEYNIAYAEYYLKKGTRIMIDSLDAANSYSDLPSIVIDGNVIEFTSENSNLKNIFKEGVYYFDFGFENRVTPEINGLPRRDVVFVDEYVAFAAKENARTLIPDGNGFVLTFVGDETINKYSGIKEGSHTDTFYTDYRSASEQYVRINDKVFPIDIIDGLRQPEGVCVLYTGDFGANTGTNKYGTEVVIKDNKVVSIESGKGGAEIPENGYVLSVHKDNGMYGSLSDISVGDEAALRLSADYSVNMLPYDGVNTVRHEDQLIVYRNRKNTGTNVYGYEIIVDADGVVTGDCVSGNAAIPEQGFVLSGHGQSAETLKRIYAIGERVTIDNRNQSVVIVRTPDIKVAAAQDAYKKALADLEKSKAGFVNIDYASAQEKLDNVESLLEGAAAASADYDYISAASKSDEAVLALKYFDYELIPSHRYENRAMWYRSSEKSDEQVRETLLKLKSLNVNALYLETWYDGNCIGFIDVDGVGHPSVNGDYDALEGFVRIGHELGIEIHCWVENFFVGYTSGNSYTSEIARKYADKLLLDKKGRNYFYYHENASFVFLNPYDRECRDVVLSVYRKLVEKYDIDGIHLDYIRFPELNYIDGVSDFGYNDDIIAGFREKTGITGDPHGFAKNSAEQKAWIDFRCGIISSFVKEVRDEVLSIDPGLWISAATYPDVKSAHDNIFQDMSTWAKNGWIDELFSMTYSADNEYVREDAMTYAKFCNGNCFYSTGLAAFSETDQVNFAHQMTDVRACGADGVAVFSLANIYPYTYQYEIQKGAFRDPSVQSYKLSETVIAGIEQLRAKLNNLKGVYKSITDENVVTISSLCDGIIDDAAEFSSVANPSFDQKIVYCGDAVKRLNGFKDEIKETAGDNKETKDLCAEIDSLIYVLELTAKRLSAR